MAVARAPERDPKGIQGLTRLGLLAGGPVVHRMTEADLSTPDVKLSFNLTEAVAAKAVVSLIFGAVSFYYLHTGRREQEPGRLLWAAVFGAMTLLVLCL